MTPAGSTEFAAQLGRWTEDSGRLRPHWTLYTDIYIYDHLATSWRCLSQMLDCWSGHRIHVCEYLSKRQKQ